MESQDPRKVFEQLVPGVGSELEGVLDRVFATGDPHEGFALLDAVHASLLRDTREFSRTLWEVGRSLPASSEDGLSYQQAQRLAERLGRETITVDERIKIENAGMSRVASRIASMGFALEQATIHLLTTFRGRYEGTPADQRVGELLRQLPDAFTSYLVAPTAERLALSGSTFIAVLGAQAPPPMTRLQIYAAALSEAVRVPDLDVRAHVNAQAELAELVYGSSFETAPGQ